jgi:hypothetical protein
MKLNFTLAGPDGETITSSDLLKTKLFSLQLALIALERDRKRFADANASQILIQAFDDTIKSAKINVEFNALMAEMPNSVSKGMAVCGLLLGVAHSEELRNLDGFIKHNLR